MDQGEQHASATRMRAIRVLPLHLIISYQVMPSISNGNWHRLSKGKYVVVAVTHPTNVDAESSLEWLGEVALEFERAKFDTPAFEVLQFANLNGQEWASFAARFTKHNGVNGVEVFITDTANAGSISVPAANVTDAAAISKFLNHVVSGDVTFNVGCDSPTAASRLHLKQLQHVAHDNSSAF